MLAKSLSANFKSTYAIGLPPNHHVSFLASSVPISDLDRRPERDIIEYALTPIRELPSESTLPEFIRKYLLFGRLYHQDGRLEAIYIDRIRRKHQYIISGVSSMYPDESHILAKWQYDAGHFSNELSFSSLGSLLDFRSVYHFDYRQARWSFGGELCYAGDENSGGLSLGGRYRRFLSSANKESLSANLGNLVDICGLINPIMGHLGLYYTRSIGSNLLMATEYDFNMYSYESDLAFGLCFVPFNVPSFSEDSNNTKNEHLSYAIPDAEMPANHPANIDKDLSMSHQLVKFRIGIGSGLAVMWEAQYGNLLIGIGASLEPTPSTGGIVSSLYPESTAPQGSLGVELQYYFD